MGKKKSEYDFVSARIEIQPDRTYAILLDDTGEVLVTGFPTHEAAEQSALDHDFDIVTQL